MHHVLTIFELKATSGATDVSLTITKAIGFFPDESAATTNMAMENPPFSMGNTSSNGGFHCHVHFRGGFHHQKFPGGWQEENLHIEGSCS